MSVERGKYTGFCVYRRSCLLWPPVILVTPNLRYDKNQERRRNKRKGEAKKWDGKHSHKRSEFTPWRGSRSKMKGVDNKWKGKTKSTK